MRLNTFGRLLAVAVVAIGLGVSSAAEGSLIITGVGDGPLPGGLPKVVELYVAANIADLSEYGIGSASNGGGTDGEEYAFPAGSATAGDFLYVVSDTAGFSDFFGFPADFNAGAAVSVNGDDAIELFYQDNVIDTFGAITYPSGQGPSQPWYHLDGWAYRVDGTGPDGTAWDISNWYFSGINGWEPGTTNAGTPNPFPAGTYAAVPEPSTIILIGLAACGLAARRRRD